MKKYIVVLSLVLILSVFGIAQAGQNDRFSPIELQDFQFVTDLPLASFMQESADGPVSDSTDPRIMRDPGNSRPALVYYYGVTSKVSQRIKLNQYIDKTRTINARFIVAMSSTGTAPGIDVEVRRLRNETAYPSATSVTGVQLSNTKVTTSPQTLTVSLPVSFVRTLDKGDWLEFTMWCAGASGSDELTQGTGDLYIYGVQLEQTAIRHRR